MVGVKEKTIAGHNVYTVLAKMRQVIPGYLYHLRQDWRQRVPFQHYIEDFRRFTGSFRSSPDVSTPPHPLRLYRELLQTLLQREDCAWRSLEAHVQGAPVNPHRVNWVLRYDLDAGDPTVALALCQVERELGLRSSVHVLVDGKLYDPTRLVPLVPALQEDGFDVGLHTLAWMHVDYA
jgi:hypothetical protein